MTKTIDIIGGGISGLATAFYLHRQQKDIRIRVWERDAQWGGLGGMFEGKGFELEKFHHHLYPRDTDLQQLVDDVGLPPVEWKPAKTGLYYYQQVYQLSSIWQLLRFRPLSFWNRLRMALFNAKVRRVTDWREMDNCTAEEYVVKYAGKAVFETVWRPLIEAKFGKYADKISAAWLWCRIVEQPPKSLGYVLGGLGKIFDRIIKELSLANHEFYLGEGIEQIVLKDGKAAQIRSSKGKILDTDVVVAALHPAQLANLLADAQLTDYQQQLRSIPFLANVCLVMVIDRSLSDFYWSKILDGRVPFAGLVEHTQWTGTDSYNGKHLAYVSSYIPQDDKRLTMSTDTLFDMYLPHIQRIFPDFNKTMVKEVYSWTAQYAQPLVETNYSQKIPNIQTPISNLFLASMAQIYPSDRQLSGGVAKAKETVGLLTKLIND